jgi:hypothetical protein
VTDTANLSLPCIEAAQAQKHVTHNEALRILDALVQLAVIDRDLSAPPPAPVEGDRFIVKGPGAGAWAGRDNAVAAWQDGGWQFLAPRPGFLAYVADERALALWDGAAWGAIGGAAGGSGREVLAADRTYYVRTDGDDAHDGLSNTPAGAFRSIQKAIDTVAALDMATYDVTVQVGPGTYTAPVMLKKTLGANAPTLRGDPATPANVTIATTGTDAITALAYSSWALQGFKLMTTASGNCMSAVGQCALVIDGAMEFGAAAASHIAVGRMAYLRIAAAAYTISGGAAAHFGVGTNAVAVVEGPTIVTLVGTPSFSGAFANVAGAGFLRASGTTFSGGAIGTRYAVAGNAVIETGGGGPNFFPGSVSGTTATGGQYY